MRIIVNSHRKRAQPDLPSPHRQHFHRHTPQHLAFLCNVLLLASVAPPSLPMRASPCMPEMEQQDGGKKLFLVRFFEHKK